MPRAYHNLRGWLRDVRQAIDDGVEDAYILAELLLEVDDLIDPSVEGAPNAAVQLPADELGDDVDGDGTDLERVPQGHGRLRELPVGDLPRVDDQVVGHARVSAASNAAIGSTSGATGVVRTTPGLTKRELVGSGGP